MSKDNPLKDTLNLPQTDFPMRAGLVEKEPKQLEAWESMDLYAQIQEKSKNNPPFILHDGPPFTNGNVHIGTALNKILKDGIIKYKTMRGFRAPYIPGWDCHGLPIEHKVAQEVRKEKIELSPVEMRQRCAQFSRDFSKTQTKQFKRLGVLADWASEYRTMDPEYESSIFKVFASFVEKDLVYRSKKPVYWSIPCATALAEAEIEYQEHTSPSIYVAFSAKEAIAGLDNVNVVIWTTTPWTLVANLAVSVHPRFTYVILEHEGNRYMVAKDLKEGFCKACGWDTIQVVKELSGSELDKIKLQHPFLDRESLLILGEHVTSESGTGCVHTAPGHGLEDYVVGLKYGLEIYCPVNDAGKYIDDGQVPAELVGVSVMDKPGNPETANKKILAILEANEKLLAHSAYQHQYPYCWRSKTPVIYRALDQWFINLDRFGERQQVLKAIDQVTWIPDWGQRRIEGAVSSRPDWCISRQRSWGVPLPVFYREDGEALLDGAVITGLAEKIKTHGTDLWFTATPAELLEGISLPEGFDAKQLTKGQDTLDVWIDSGCSHVATLKENPALAWPADLYLEGSDQHRGWFQSSAWTGVISEGKAPYKKVVTHGFVVNEQRKKISKSDKTSQAADDYVNEYGADIVRLWVFSEDYKSDIPVSKNIFKQIVQGYRGLRNTLRFQLGNLYDFDISKDEVSLNDMEPLDQWVLHKTFTFEQHMREAMDDLEFHKAFKVLNRFVTHTLSAIYHDIIKDRLYTYGPDWTERRSTQTAIYHILNTLMKVIAPLVPFTTEEVYQYFNTPSKQRSIHLENWPTLPKNWHNESLAGEFEHLFEVRDRVNEKLEEARQSKMLGTSLDAHVSITLAQDEKRALAQKYESLLPELFIVSQVTLKETQNGEGMSAEVQLAEGEKCPRSWRRVTKLVDIPEGIKLESKDKVSERDSRALLSKYSN